MDEKLRPSPGVQRREQPAGGSQLPQGRLGLPPEQPAPRAPRDRVVVAGVVVGVLLALAGLVFVISRGEPWVGWPLVVLGDLVLMAALVRWAVRRDPDAGRLRRPSVHE